MAREYDRFQSVEERNREMRERGRERRLQKAFAEARLGGMSLSERLRQPDAQRSTKVRRRIKELFKDEDAKRTFSGTDQTFYGGIDVVGRGQIENLTF